MTRGENRESDHVHVIDTGKGSFTLAELGALLPGMAEIMPLVGDRIWKCYHAGRARNRRLAVFQLKEAVNLMRKGAALRPKYRDDIERFVADEVAVVRRTIERGHWQAFETAFAAMIDRANEYHVQYGKAFLRWRVPANPPQDLDLTPQSE